MSINNNCIFPSLLTDRHSHDPPEVQKSEEAKFKEVGEAFNVLSDVKKRARYDNGFDMDDNDIAFGESVKLDDSCL